ncbi:hypothetical protein OAE16_01645 [Porticoccaceae bacterium]|nr:hypothetical protein [Porticoccaceae bacterium]
MIAEAKLESIAEGAIYHSIQILAQPNNAGKAAIKNQYTIEFAGTEIDIQIEDERNKIDINSAQESLITALLAYHLVGAQEAVTIGETMRNLRTLTTEKLFKNTAQFTNISPLIASIYSCIQPYITVYSGQSGIDYGSAPKKIKSLLDWADTERWNNQLWAPNQPTNRASAVGNSSSVMRTSISHSGHAFTINATVSIEDDYQLTRSAIIRLTGNRLDPFWLMEIATKRRGNGQSIENSCKVKK